MLYKDQTYPLSSQQKMVWFDNLLSEGLPSYNIGMALVFKAKLNLAVLEQAIQQVIAERDVLRVHFQQSNQEVVQHFSNKSTFTLSEKDFSKTTNPEKSAWQYIDQQFKTAFDIFAQSQCRSNILFIFLLSSSRIRWFITLTYLSVDY